MHLHLCRCMPKALGTCLLGARTWMRRAVLRYGMPFLNYALRIRTCAQQVRAQGL